MGSDFGDGITVVASVDIYHSRPIAPTRRIALGARDLPVGPGIGLGGVLLAGVVAAVAGDVAGELRQDLVDIMDTLSEGGRVVQPRARHRLQTDIVGLTLSRQSLLSVEGQLEFDLKLGHGSPLQMALGAAYCAGSLPEPHRSMVMDALMSALVWEGSVDTNFIRFVFDGHGATLDALHQWSDPVSWALDVLGIDGAELSDRPSTAWPAARSDQILRRLVHQRFRARLREAHPDHGAAVLGAGRRVWELTEARRILLGS